MTTMELLKEQFARLNEELERLNPGSKEYHEVVDDVREIHRLIMAEDKASAEIEYKNQQEERETAKLELEVMKETLKEAELNKPWYKKIDINTVISGGVTLAGIGAVLNYERIGNVTSKALSFIPKPRLK